MTGRILLLLSFVFISEFSVAQREDRNWVFGDSVGIDFNNLSNLTVFFPNARNDEMTASISDSVGNLLFYTAMKGTYAGFTYETVVNPQGQIMENGDSIENYPSASNGSIIIPMPGAYKKYYLFTTTYNYFINDVYYLKYSVIDMALNNFNGKVVEKNILLEDSVAEQVLAIKHANGRDWWLLERKFNSDTIIKFLISEGGISGPFYQQIGSKFYCQVGENSVTKSGNRIAYISNYGNIDLMDFDRCSGELSNYIELGTQPYDSVDLNGWMNYGCEFSPDGNKFYISKWKYVSLPDTFFTSIFQFSINCPQIANSKTEIFSSHGYWLYQLQLAPNNKIYVSGHYSPGIFLDSSYNYLSVIKSPNDSGAACDFHLFDYYLQGKSGLKGLPNMPNYNLGKLVGSPCDTLTSIQNENLKTKSSVRIFPNPATEQLTIDNARLPFGQGQFTITEIEITDVMGRIIYQEQTHSHLSIIHCQLFSAGIYFVKVYMNDGSVEVRKFVKQ